MSRTNQVLRLLLAAAGVAYRVRQGRQRTSMIGGPNASNASVPEFDILTTANDDRLRCGD
jgi:hypothetical protein